MKTQDTKNEKTTCINKYLQAYREWCREYPFNLFFTVSFPDSPSSSELTAYRTVKKNLGILIERARKVVGIKSTAGIGLIVRNTQTKVLHVHCLLWVGEDSDELEEMIATLQSLSLYQCRADKVYDINGIAEYVYDQHHFTHTTDADLFTHNDKLLKGIRFAKPQENQAP